jgi:hypothetical protein
MGEHRTRAIDERFGAGGASGQHRRITGGCLVTEVLVDAGRGGDAVAARWCHELNRTVGGVVLTIRTVARTGSPSRALASVHYRALFAWLSVYSAIIVAQWTLGTSIAHLPLPARTLILIALVVPAVAYVLVPALLQLYAAARRALPARLTCSTRPCPSVLGAPKIRRT